MEPTIKEKEYIDALLEQSKAGSIGLTQEQTTASEKASAKERGQRNVADNDHGRVGEREIYVVGDHTAESFDFRVKESNLDKEIDSEGGDFTHPQNDNTTSSSSSTQLAIVPRRYFPPNISGGDGIGQEGYNTGYGSSQTGDSSHGSENGHDRGNDRTLVTAFPVGEQVNVDMDSTVWLEPQDQPPLVTATPAPKDQTDGEGFVTSILISHRKCLVQGFAIFCFIMLTTVVLTVILLWNRGKRRYIPAMPPEKEQGGYGGSRIYNMTHGVAKANRYWDCTGGACGCAHLPYDDPDKPAYCHGNILVRAPDDNPHGASFYGTGTINDILGGDWWLGEGCTKCWKLTGTSNAGPTAGNTTTTIVIKGTNYCPSFDCGRAPAFGIAAPGFLDRGNSPCSACEEREFHEDIKSWSTCRNWSKEEPANCDCSVFKDPILTEGCENFLSLGWDNILVSYEALEDCPIELGSLPCWEANGNNYPDGVPELCALPYDHAAK